MLIEAWLCQKTKGARRPSAVGLTEGSWHRVALSLSLRLLRRLLTNPLARPRSAANAGDQTPTQEPSTSHGLNRSSKLANCH